MRNLVELFSKDSYRKYRIPMYQRNYTWERENIDQLFSDLERLVHIKGAEKHHFGSIYMKREKEEEVNSIREEEFVIIDGQQRMTTILLIYLVMYRVSEEKQIKAKRESDVESAIMVDRNLETLRDYLYLEDGGELRIRMELNRDDNEALDEILEGDLAGSLNLKTNYRLIDRTIRESDYSVKNYIDAIGRLEVMEVRLAEYDNEQEIFDGLNAKGKPLNFGEQMKNYFLMGKEREEQEFLYEEYWLPIERGLDYKIGDNFKNLVELYFTIYNEAQIKGNVPNYNRAKMFIKDNNMEKDDVLANLKKTLNTRTEIKELRVRGHKIEDKLARIGRIAGDNMMVFLVPSYEKYREGIIPEEEYENVLHFLEGYLVRRMLITSGVGEESVYDWINKVGMESLESGGRYDEAVIEAMRSRIRGKGEYPTDNKIREEGVRLQHSVRGKERRKKVYLMERLENGHSKEYMEILENYGEGNAYSIEHIMPQKLTETWESMLGDNYEEVHKEYLNMIGNLTLTGYNSSYGNKPFQEKQNMLYGYRRSKFTWLNLMPAQEEVWTKEEIEKRARAIIERVIDLYPY